MAEQKALAMAPDNSAALIEQVVIGGDLAKLAPSQRVQYYNQVCRSLGLNPLTQPFQYITLNNKLTLYARKDATDQLRKLHDVSIDKPDIRFEDDWIIVTVSGHDKTGRSDADVGVVSRKDMRGDFGNALMKAVTKAKRRLTLSMVGLGWLDETELDSIPDARPANVNTETGEILAPSLPGPQSGAPDGRPAWSEREQRRFTELALGSHGLGLTATAMKALLPELREGMTLSELGTVDEVIGVLIQRRDQKDRDEAERLAQELSDAGDAKE